MLYVKILCPALGLMTCHVGYAQEEHLIFTRDFTQLLEDHDLHFFKPADSWLRIIPLHEDEFMRYDLVLENPEIGQEYRIRVRKIDEETEMQSLIVEAIRLAASIASNNPADSIIARYPDQDWLKSTMRADWGMYFDFSPKVRYSEKMYGRFITIYARQGTVVDIILLTDMLPGRELPDDPLIRFDN